jgi:D-alanyl-lipoteichoic acid acyltransferase DltB (MBOAT superfamily)
VLPPLKTKHSFEYDTVTNGLKLMAWGFFQKVVVADRLARIVSPVFDHPTEHHGLLLIVASVAFAFEIYFDFAGYSDIAIGAAQVMGIRLMTNFRRPYYSKSISEFWTRWHISLSTWFRDYVYVPLGGNRVSKPRWYANLMIVFLLSGLWHGANWTFLVWGGLNGLYLIVARIVDPVLPPFLKANNRPWVRAWNVASVFALATIAFVFFRAKRVSDGFYILRHMPTGIASDLRLLAHRDFHALIGGRGFPLPKEWAIAFIGLVVIQLVHLAQRSGSVRKKLSLQPAWVRWPVYFGLVYAPLFFASAEPVQFIYFQF